MQKHYFALIGVFWGRWGELLWEINITLISDSNPLTAYREIWEYHFELGGFGGFGLGGKPVNDPSKNPFGLVQTNQQPSGNHLFQNEPRNGNKNWSQSTKRRPEKELCVFLIL